MKTITLTDIIDAESKDPVFTHHFQREMLINQIAKFLIQMRKEEGLTQKELAIRAHTSQSVIARLESGTDSRMPSLDLLTRLAQATNARLQIMFEHTTV
jgi:predicted transcriptional regulator